MTALRLEEFRQMILDPDIEYRAKQCHPVPVTKSVVRETFLLERAQGRVVLDIGASGKMHEAICNVAARCYGIDKPSIGWSDVAGPERNGDDFGIDLDDYHAELPDLPGVELIICGEVIEHLSNPGWFLDRLRKYRCPVIVTVPNAFGDSGRRWMERGTENVNPEHVAYYSFHTLKELVTRHGFEVIEHYWYKGRPRFAEGLIFVMKAR